MESSQAEICRPKFMSNLQRISKIRPEMVHKALNSIAIEEKSQQQRLKDVKVLQLFPCEKSQEEGDSSQMTIFYNGNVHAYNVSDDKARQITELANFKNMETKSMEQSEVNKAFPPSSEIQSECGKGGLAIVRKASLQRFLQKRKDRFNKVSSPYYSSSKSKISSSSSLEPSQGNLDLNLNLAPL